MIISGTATLKSIIVSGTATLGAMLVSGTATFSTVPILPDDTIETADIQDNAVTLAKMAGLARGKVIYGDASGDPAALAVGATSTVLTTDGVDISWVASAGGGKVLQVVSMTTTSSTTTTSSSYVDTNLTLAITPAASSSVIIVQYNATFNLGGTRGEWSDIGLERGTTDIHNFSGEYAELGGASGNFDLHLPSSGIMKDTPNTSGAVTYTVRIKTSAGTAKLISRGTGSLVLTEIGA